MSASAETPRRSNSGLSWPAQLYLFAVYATAVFAFALGWQDAAPTTDEWEAGVLLAVCAAAAQLLVVHVPSRNASYHLTPGILVAAAILLPPQLVALVAVAQHVPEWLKLRYPWYIQTFNIANFGLSALAAGFVFRSVAGADGLWHPATEIGLYRLAAGVLASIVFVVIQHGLLALVLKFARGHSIAESGMFSSQSLIMDIVLAMIGPVIALLWVEAPLLVVFGLAPLVLLYRALSLPQLAIEAQMDAKTDLYNARHFSAALSEEFERAKRASTPLSLLVIDLDLLRDINNRYGHLAGDVVLTGIARIFRGNLRPGDLGARFGGEEFCIVLRDTDTPEAIAIAERIRKAVEEQPFDVDTSVEPIHATVSIGISTFPLDADNAHNLLHRADLAAYRAKAEGRNRVVACSGEIVEAPTERHEADHAHEDMPTAPSSPVTPAPVVATSPPEAPPATAPSSVSRPQVPGGSRPVLASATPKPAAAPAPPPAANSLASPPAVRRLAAFVFGLGLLVGAAGIVVQPSDDVLGLLLLAGLVAAGQALAVEFASQGSVSVSAVGSIAGAAIFGPRAALLLAAAVCAVDWSANRGPLHKVLFNVGALTLAGTAASSLFLAVPDGRWQLIAGAAVAGTVYYLVNIGLLTTVITLETHETWIAVARERFAWLFVHYVVYGVVGGMIAVAYDAVGLLGMIVFALPLALVRKAQLDYVEHTEENVRALRDAAATIERQNTSLTHAYALLQDRATETMESLAAAVDARDAYTAGHSRRVQEVSVAIGLELGLRDEALESVSFAALFHDVGKLALPDSVLLKPGPLDPDEWEVVRRHPEEGEKIIGHLGFLSNATSAIRHHHERFDGSGYPDGLAGSAIPIGARVLHVADAFDSMVSSRVYRPALPLQTAMDELRRGTGTQFCPECVAALDRALASGILDDVVEDELAA
jgi:diguanylate cyclase (GGDEF)-like protein